MSRRRRNVRKKGTARKPGTQQNRPTVSVRVKASNNKTTKKRTISKRRRRNRLILIITSIVLVIAAAAFFIFRSDIFDSAPDQISVTVAWNPGSIADDIVREMARATDTQITIQNITGANGANGANAIFQSERNGASLLSTSLSALVTAEAMGFTDNSYTDWAAWLCAFSPAVVVVANDSPYHSMDDLIAVIRQNPGRLRCANSGDGTVSFVAAELLSTRVVLEFDHISYSGSSQAAEALKESESQEAEADFAILLSIEAANHLRSGQLRAIGAFTGSDHFFSYGNPVITVPSISGIDHRLDNVLPFGEYFGLFIPTDTPQSKLHGLDDLVNTVVDSQTFSHYLLNNGLVATAIDRSENTQVMEHFSSIINWTLYDVGYLPTNPGALGIARP